MEALQMAEGSILLWIQEFLRTDWLTPGMLTITKLGSMGFIWVVLSLVFLCFKKTRWAGAAGLLAVFFSLVFNNYFLKNLFERIRPYEVIDGLTLLVHRASDFSFPSGHAGTSFAAATAFCWMLRGRFRWLPYVLAFLIAFSRLYVGIHYPTDVLCGMLTGSLCGIAAGILIHKVQSKWETLRGR